MDMPPDVKETLEQCERMVKEITFQHSEECRRRCKPYIDIIFEIKAMYPEPIVITMDQAQAMGLIPKKEST
jgi:hypothetical protein